MVSNLSLRGEAGTGTLSHVRKYKVLCTIANVAEFGFSVQATLKGPFRTSWLHDQHKDQRGTFRA